MRMLSVKMIVVFLSITLGVFAYLNTPTCLAGPPIGAGYLAANRRSQIPPDLILVARIPK